MSVWTLYSTLLLNQLYDNMDCYYSLSLPVMHLSRKVLIPATDDQPVRVRRRYDPSRTPVDRLCDTDAITNSHRQRLMELRHSINPRRLLEEICALRDKLFSLPSALPGVTENAHDTLHYPHEEEMPYDDSHQTTAIWPSYPCTANELSFTDKAKRISQLHQPTIRLLWVYSSQSFAPAPAAAINGGQHTVRHHP